MFWNVAAPSNPSKVRSTEYGVYGVLLTTARPMKHRRASRPKPDVFGGAPHRAYAPTLASSRARFVRSPGPVIPGMPRRVVDVRRRCLDDDLAPLTGLIQCARALFQPFLQVLQDLLLIFFLFAFVSFPLALCHFEL